MVIQHPLGEYAPSATDNPGDTAFHLHQVLNQQPSVDGLVINPLLTVLLDDVQEVVLREAFNRAMHTFQRLIDGNRADRHGRRLDD
ncbi:MAG: Uncharacterised protein [Cyanobium sp. ARS6]|nr:MAG: Uncharacterised protein [Cyanobium sp. ARS6]